VLLNSQEIFKQNGKIGGPGPKKGQPLRNPAGAKPGEMAAMTGRG
jgi:hypothetical protein